MGEVEATHVDEADEDAFAVSVPACVAEAPIVHRGALVRARPVDSAIGSGRRSGWPSSIAATRLLSARASARSTFRTAVAESPLTAVTASRSGGRSIRSNSPGANCRKTLTNASGGSLSLPRRGGLAAVWGSASSPRSIWTLFASWGGTMSAAQCSERATFTGVLPFATIRSFGWSLFRTAGRRRAMLHANSRQHQSPCKACP